MANAAAHRARPPPARLRVTAANGIASATNEYVSSRMPSGAGTGAPVHAVEMCNSAARPLTA
jgi:hypothetical protein